MIAITKLHRDVDVINAKLAEASAQKGKPITCQGKGCCACCYEPVYCSSAEVKHLLATLTEDQKDIVSIRLQQNMAVVNASGLFQKEMPPVMDWLALKLPCPLLENGACMIYERRPVSCRSHMAVGPPEWCETNRLNQKYPQAKEASLAMGQLIVLHHLEIGNIMVNDNLLALLAGELLHEPFHTASAEKIEFNT